MKVYQLQSGILLEKNGAFYLLKNRDWDGFINRDDLAEHLEKEIQDGIRVDDPNIYLEQELLPPIKNQEIWAAGVTYFRSREARMEESKDAGGGDFYDRVYDAPRPELFFKSTAYRTVGSGGKVRIRKDSAWNVPEPELTLFLAASGKIVGYTCGNDMSSRDIEGENPLYLPCPATRYPHFCAPAASCFRFCSEAPVKHHEHRKRLSWLPPCISNLL